MDYEKSNLAVKPLTNIISAKVNKVNINSDKSCWYYASFNDLLSFDDSDDSKIMPIYLCDLPPQNP